MSRIIKALLFLLIGIIIVSCSSEKATFYLSPDGDDSNKGTRNQPYKTIKRAQKEVRKLIDSKYKGEIHILLADGIYELEESLIFTLDDSGNDSLAIFYEAAESANPSISGGRTVSQINSEDGKWAFNLLNEHEIKYHDIYVNDKRVTRARTPNQGFYMMKSVDEEILVQGTGRAPKSAIQTITFSQKDVLNNFSKLAQEEIKKIRFVAFHKWDNTVRYIDEIDTLMNTFSSRGKGMKPWNRMTTGTRLFFENYQEALDTAGEWFHSTSGFEYIPLADQSLSETQITVPVLENLLVVSGKPEEGKYVRNIHFKGLKFKYVACNMPENGFEPNQAAAYIEAAIMIDGAKDISFYDCEISQTGQHAIWFRRGCKDCKLEKCFLNDLGGGGVRIGEVLIRENKEEHTELITIDNCIIQSGGFNFPCAVGVWIGHSGNNNITNCDISDFRYTGVSVGWHWGYGLSLAKNNKIMHNKIHHIGWSLLSDMAGVYSLGPSEGTEVSNNVVHDIYAYTYGGWGLYTDEGSSYIKMENNLVYNTKTGGFHQHYGKENIIRNNIFAFADKYQLQATRIEEHQSFSFKNNIVVGKEGVLLAGPWKSIKLEMDSNCYWFNDEKSFDFVGLTFEEWKQETGHDQNSMIKEPGIIDIDKGTYKLNDRLAGKIGFKKFDPNEAGVYGDENWKKKAELPETIIKEFEATVIENRNKK
jgi:hypothetical protein